MPTVLISGLTVVMLLWRAGQDSGQVGLGSRQKGFHVALPMMKQCHRKEGFANPIET